MTRGYSLPLYELAPTNGRSADSQAVYYGYGSADELAADLPPDADVIDVGAGISDLGRAIATARPDISMTCLDIRFADPTILAEAIGDNAPPNMSFVDGDILDIEAIDVALGAFDRAYSSRLIPHIELEDAKLARDAILNIGRLLKSDGYMLLLCRFHPLLRDKLLCHPTAIQITKQELLDNPDPVLSHAISAIRLPDIHRWRQIVHNVHATAHFGQSRWRRPDAEGRIFPMRGEIWDPEQAEFVPRRSLRGHTIYTGFLRRVIVDPIPRRTFTNPSQFILFEVNQPEAHGLSPAELFNLGAAANAKNPRSMEPMKPEVFCDGNGNDIAATSSSLRYDPIRPVFPDVFSHY